MVSGCYSEFWEIYGLRKHIWFVQTSPLPFLIIGILADLYGFQEIDLRLRQYIQKKKYLEKWKRPALPVLGKEGHQPHDIQSPTPGKFFLWNDVVIDDDDDVKNGTDDDIDQTLAHRMMSAMTQPELYACLASSSLLAASLYSSSFIIAPAVLVKTKRQQIYPHNHCHSR